MNRSPPSPFLGHPLGSKLGELVLQIRPPNSIPAVQFPLCIKSLATASLIGWPVASS
jgi:hypothetical protein